MDVSAFSGGELAARLRRGGIPLRIGPFVARLRSAIPSVAEGVGLLYRDYAVADDHGFVDFHVELAPPKNLRRWFRSQVLFLFDGRTPFKPLPSAQAFPFFEWGLNWCVANYAHQYLVIHAAVVAKDGEAVILPGAPGSGKSTLCAGLVARGWRLLSDELTLLCTRTGAIAPLPRPVSLKNESIDVLCDFAPGATIGPTIVDTRKGTVAHVRPPRASVQCAAEHARPRWIIFPKYQMDGDAELVAQPRGGSFLRVAEHAFNYSVLGVTGFRTLADMINGCDCYDFRYSDLAQAVAVFEDLARNHVASERPTHTHPAGTGADRLADAR
jgi:HprK-related kinase A